MSVPEPVCQSVTGSIPSPFCASPFDIELSLVGLGSSCFLTRKDLFTAQELTAVCLRCGPGDLLARLYLSPVSDLLNTIFWRRLLPSTVIVRVIFPAPCFFFFRLQLWVNLMVTMWNYAHTIRGLPYDSRITAKRSEFASGMDPVTD